MASISRWSPYEGGQHDRFYCIHSCLILLERLAGEIFPSIQKKL
jgi:hypothetical protein